MTQAERIFHGFEAEQRVRELSGLHIEVFRRAAQMGFAERANCNRFDPVTTAGTEAWRYPTRYLRNACFDVGYRLDDPKNLPLAISDEFKINITVSSGDENTGLVFHSRQPRTKNPKGSLLAAAIDRNLDQMSLFPELDQENIVKFRMTMGYPTWVFLLYITDDEIRAELSLPKEMDDANHITKWTERIIIGVMPPDFIGEDVDHDSGPDILPEIQIKM